MKHKQYTVGVIFLLILTGLSGYGLARPDTTADIVAASSSTAKVDKKVSQNIAKIGILVCLSPAGDGPHTMECAFGLQQDDGTIYGLGSDDPMLIGAIPTGQKIEVTGDLSKPQDTKYKTEGTIQVDSVTRL